MFVTSKYEDQNNIKKKSQLKHMWTFIKYNHCMLLKLLITMTTKIDFHLFKTRELSYTVPYPRHFWPRFLMFFKPLFWTGFHLKKQHKNSLYLLKKHGAGCIRGARTVVRPLNVTQPPLVRWL